MIGLLLLGQVIGEKTWRRRFGIAEAAAVGLLVFSVLLLYVKLTW